MKNRKISKKSEKGIFCQVRTEGLPAPSPKLSYVGEYIGEYSCEDSIKHSFDGLNKYSSIIKLKIYNFTEETLVYAHQSANL